MEPIFEFEKYTFRYHLSREAVLKDLDLKILPGEFITILGGSGSGKTTLLSLMRQLRITGEEGRGLRRFRGTPMGNLDERTLATGIGFVPQDPEDGLVTGEVWHELAFSLENQGIPSETIHQKVAEISHYFGITDWFHKKTEELSGGQKQILNLASVMITGPDLLLLDEPTAQLDPISAGDFMNLLTRLHREMGITVVMASHRSEECAHTADRMVFLEDGNILIGDPPEVLTKLDGIGRDAFLPEVSYVSLHLPDPSPGFLLPLEAGEAGRFLSDYAERHLPLLRQTGEEENRINAGEEGSAVVSVDDLWFRYQKNGKDVLKDFALQLPKGSVTALLGGNGCGKSTLLKLIAGLLPLQKGRIKKQGVIRLLPQDPKLLFTAETVGGELSVCKDPKKREELCRLCQLKGLEDRHPYDLSGGEAQKLALFLLLLDAPEILLLDEPAKGLDPEYVRDFVKILRDLAAKGHTILLVSHNILFCRDVADRCALLFDGRIARIAGPREFFTENTFYTTDIRRMAGRLIPGAVAPKDVLDVFGGYSSQTDGRDSDREGGRDQSSDRDPADEEEQSTEKNGAKRAQEAERSLAESARVTGETAENRTGGLSVSEYLIHLLPVALIPVTVLFGTVVLQGKKYLFISLLVLAEALLPEVILFEKKKHTSGEVTLLACMIAMTVCGRLLFMPFPEVKPVTALVLITGVAFGPSFGFLCGAFGMLISNMLMGQGAWSPWQMTAMGLLGLIAGLLFHSSRERFVYGERIRMLALLCVYAFFSVVLLYGGIMNPAAAVLSGIELNRETLIAYYLSGFPFDLIHAFSTVIFLLLLMIPMLKKLERVRLKYL